MELRDVEASLGALQVASRETGDPPADSPSPGPEPRADLADAGTIAAEDLIQLQKLAAMGTMAAMLAHEFNNLLTRAINQADGARATLDDRERTADALKKILDSCGRAAELSRSILDFAGRSDARFRPVAVLKVVSEAIQCLGRDPAKDNIAIRCQVPAGLTVQANATLLQQVLYNLVLNARQAILGHGGPTRRGGRITVSADRRNGQVLIRVADTGCGIAPEDLPRIFTPFFSTKSGHARADRRGIGLGLAICRAIVVEHGGAIEVQSTPGQGSTFTLCLPGN